MRSIFSLPTRSTSARIAAAMLLISAAGYGVWAQVEGERGIAPVAASADIHVTGIEVDVHADTGVEARAKGWQEAAKKAWAKIDGPEMPDSQIQSLVSAIAIERERLGPKRYIATLGVIFDRQRAARYLGTESAAERSAPLLLIPVTMTGGSLLVYEQRNPWQRAWAEYQAGASRIDYVRPAGSGGDSLLITYGQTGRRSRIWWRNILDQFGASDVIVPIARLRYLYPGGPVEGRFTARYGPDSTYLGSFTMTATGPDQLPEMLDKAVLRFDAIFTRALNQGLLKPDPTLDIAEPQLSPVVARLIEMGRAARAREAAAAASASATEIQDNGDTITAAPVRNPPPEGSVGLYTVQVATPDVAAFNTAITAVRSAPGVRSAGVRSTAIGGTSVMTVGFSGSLGELAEALRGRGFTVNQGGDALSISR